jgi:thioredoxin-dependent peroxiredoxin
MAKKTTKKKAVKKATKKAPAKKATKKKIAPKKKAPAKKKVATKKAAPKKKAPAKKKVAAPKAPAKKAAAALPALGSVAPSFTLHNQDGQAVSLESFRGQNVVVYFYPRAMTPGCTVQACGLRDKKTDLAANGIVVLGISPDAPKALKKFQEKDGLNFDLLSDADHKVAEAYGSWGQKQFMGKTFDGILRQSFLLDKEGRIAHIISKVDTKTHAEDVLGFYSKL